MAGTSRAPAGLLAGVDSEAVEISAVVVLVTRGS